MKASKCWRLTSWEGSYQYILQEVVYQSRSCMVFAAGYHTVEKGPRKLGDCVIELCW